MKDGSTQQPSTSSLDEAIDADVKELLSKFTNTKDVEKIHAAFTKARENEKKLAKKCSELNAEIVTNATKVEGVLRQAQEDKESLQVVKKDLQSGASL